VRLRARGGEQQLFWLVNGALVGKSAVGASLHYQFPNEGEFRVTVTDLAGDFDSLTVRVRS
jgi:membrane carboxypeptidase/penicillin-binding protein PbpC